MWNDINHFQKESEIRFGSKVYMNEYAGDFWRIFRPHYFPIFYKRLNTGMAPTYDWMIKIVKVNKLYLNSLLVSIV